MSVYMCVYCLTENYQIWTTTQQEEEKYVREVTKLPHGENPLCPRGANPC